MFFIFPYLYFAEGVHKERFMHSWKPSYPAINLYETEDLFLLEALIPGVQESDIQISIYKNMIYLSGCVEKKAGSYYRQETHIGGFLRQIPISSPIQKEGIKKHYAKGLLLITFPKFLHGGIYE